MSQPPGPAARIEVGMLLSPPADNRRVAEVLHRAGYRPVVPGSVLDWAAQREHVVLVTTDSEQSLAVLRSVLDAGRDARAVVLVQDADPHRYRMLLRHCTAALPWGSSDHDIVLAVQAAGRALSCLPTAAARALTGAREKSLPQLNDRERSWLRALADSVTVASLARTSGYSQREMYRLLADVYSRLGVTNRTEALLRADRLGLLRPPTDGVPIQPQRTAPRAPTGRTRS